MSGWDGRGYCGCRGRRSWNGDGCVGDLLSQNGLLGDHLIGRCEVGQAGAADIGSYGGDAPPESVGEGIWDVGPRGGEKCAKDCESRDEFHCLQNFHVGN